MSVVQSKSISEIASDKSLTQFDYLRSKTTTSSSQFYKNGWFHLHELQQDILRKSKTPSLLLIGDSVAYGFKRYPHIWEKRYGNLAVNCGMAGDKVENTLWRVENLALPCGIEYAVIICGTNNNDYNKASSIVNGLLFVALKLVSKSVEQVKISGILPREIVNSIRRNKIKEVNGSLKTECSKLTSRVFYMEPDWEWVTNENLLNMKHFYRDHPHLIEEGYEKLSKTISMSLMYACPYIQDDAKKSYYPPLKHYAIFKVSSEPPFQEPLLSEGEKKEKFTNKRDIFTVKRIKRSIQEVVAEPYAVPNVLAVEVVRTPQLCSARLSIEQDFKSANYVDTYPPQDKAEVILNLEPRDVENKTSDLCGLPVKTSRFKRHDVCGNLFSFLHFITHNVELPKCLVPSFSKLGIFYAFFLITFLANSNFINLNSNHKIISFTYKISFTEILDVDKLRLRYKRFHVKNSKNSTSNF